MGEYPRRFSMELFVVQPTAASWNQEIDTVCAQLGTRCHHLLFPSYFLKATFRMIGGRLVVARKGAKLVCAGFLFPRAMRDDLCHYTLRLHWADDRVTFAAQGLFSEMLFDEIQRLMEPAVIDYYDPVALQHYPETHQDFDGIDIGRPNAQEATLIRQLQQEIWRCDPAYLYPFDLHSEEFHAATSLVARNNGEVIGFLFGFYSFAQPNAVGGRGMANGFDLRIESQLMAVIEPFRNRDIGFQLKQAQAKIALECGITCVQWTADPLQYVNAIFNFTKLRANAFEFLPDHYSFRDALNQVKASRLHVSWLLDQPAVRQHLASPPKTRVPALNEFGQVERMNSGPIARTDKAASATIAIEIPSDWTGLQQHDLVEARQWRKTTDDIFSRQLNFNNYVITDVAREGEKRFLVARNLEML